MSNLKKLGALALVVVVSALYAQIEVGDPAPQFTIYQYKDKTFDTDTVYGIKIAAFIFGSIT